MTTPKKPAEGFTSDQLEHCRKSIRDGKKPGVFDRPRQVAFNPHDVDRWMITLDTALGAGYLLLNYIRTIGFDETNADLVMARAVINKMMPKKPI